MGGQAFLADWPSRECANLQRERGTERCRSCFRQLALKLTVLLFIVERFVGLVNDMWPL